MNSMVNVTCLNKRYCQIYKGNGKLEAFGKTYWKMYNTMVNMVNASPLVKRYCQIYEAMVNARPLTDDFPK